MGGRGARVAKGLRRGFTLIELLTVVAILSVVTTMGMQMFIKVMDVRQTSMRSAQLAVRATKALEELRRDFGHVLSSRLTGVGLRGDDATFKVSGAEKGFDDDRILLPVSEVNVYTGLAEHHLVAYKIDRSETFSGSVLTRRRVTSDLGAIPEAEGEVRMENVVAINIEYNDGTNWLPSWNETQLPKAVRVGLTMVHPVRTYEQVSRKAVFNINVR